MPPGLHSAPLHALGSATHATLSKSDSLAPPPDADPGMRRWVSVGSICSESRLRYELGLPA